MKGKGLVRHVHLQEGSSFLLPINDTIKTDRQNPKTELHTITQHNFYLVNFKALSHDDNNSKSNVTHMLLQ